MVTPGFAEQAAAYISGRRWFAGKGRDFSITHVHPMPWLNDGNPRLRFEVLTVEYDDGRVDTYQFPVAYLRYENPAYAHALVGPVDDEELGAVVAYDAVYLKDASDLLLDGFRHRTTTPSASQGDNALEFHVVDSAALPEPGAHGTVMTAEQSNTSIAFGEQAILKLFRRLSSGHNPDIEIHEALTRHGDEHVAPLLGWLHGSWQEPDGSQHSGHLGMLQEFLRTATDGWDLATASMRDLLVEEDLHPDEVGGDFASESERLGEATAVVHRHLAEVFGTAVLTRDQLRALADAMRERLRRAEDVVPALREHRSGLLARYERLAELDHDVTAQRIHGDFHLGQTLRTVKGWKIIDFEGEPAKSLAERQQMDSPWRDVAGMLRSFGYAAGATLRQFGKSDQLTYRAAEWTGRNTEAFLRGYCGVPEPAGNQTPSAAASDNVADPVVALETVDPRAGDAAALLAAYEADKAVYEAVYEARNRPTWLTIPLAAIARIATTED